MAASLRYQLVITQETVGEGKNETYASKITQCLSIVLNLARLNRKIKMAGRRRMRSIWT